MVYAPLASKFNESVRDIYTRQTRLNMVRQNGDLELEGEITVKPEQAIVVTQILEAIYTSAKTGKPVYFD